MSTRVTDGLDLVQLHADLEVLSWPERFDRLARDAKTASDEGKVQIARLREALADEALAELQPSWHGLPLKEGVLRLPDKRMRGALGSAAKRARDRCIVELVRATPFPLAAPARVVGTGFDERVVEIPLALHAARLHEPGAVLDAGSALNLPVVREVVGRPAAEVTHFTLPGSVEPVLPGDHDRYLQSFGDLRAMPFPDGAFSRVACVSTLEHVGLDTSRFGASGASGAGAPETAPAAVAELARVLAPGGTLLLTVPYGEAADHGWFRIFDRDGLAPLLAPLRGLHLRERYFFYEAGWVEGGATPPASLTPSPYNPDVITGVAVVEARKSA